MPTARIFLCLVLALQPLFPEPPALQQGIQYFHRKEYPDALKLFTAALVKAPDSALCLSYLGAARFHTNDADGCVEALQKALYLDPQIDDPILRHYLALSFYHLKLYHQSKEAFQQTIKMNPQSKVAAKIFQHLGQIEKFFENQDARQSHEVYFKSGLAYLNHEQFHLARIYLTEAHRIAPEDLGTILHLGIAFNYTGYYKSSFDLLENLKDAESLYHSGLASFHLENYRESSTRMEQAWTLSGRQKAAFYASKSFAQLGMPEKVAYYVIHAYPEGAFLERSKNLDLGVAFMNAGKAELAHSYYLKALGACETEEQKSEIEAHLANLPQIEPKNK